VAVGVVLIMVGLILLEILEVLVVVGLDHLIIQIKEQEILHQHLHHKEILVEMVQVLPVKQLLLVAAVAGLGKLDNPLREIQLPEMVEMGKHHPLQEPL
jgi:hypothetical protein